MAFERPVLLGGAVYLAHEVDCVELLASGVEVAHVTSTDASGDTRESRFERGAETSAALAEAEAWVSALPAMAAYADPALADAEARAGEASALLSEVASLLTDEQAARVPAAFPEWEAGAAYAEGQRVRRGGALFRCVQPHASQDGWVPGETPALWAEVRAGQQGGDGGTPAEWAQPTGAQDAYAKGDRVAYGGQVWESTMDGNVWSPEAYPAGWLEVSA